MEKALESASGRNVLLSEVLFIEDLAGILRTSRSTIERRRRAGSFPIPELPSIDGRPRWSRQAVEQFLATTSKGSRPIAGRRSNRIGPSAGVCR